MGSIVLLSPALFFLGLLGFIFFTIMLFVNKRLESYFLKLCSIVVLVASIIMVLIPVGIIFLIRMDMKDQAKDEFYTDTGIYADAVYDEAGNCSFTFEGEEYKALILDGMDCFEYVDSSKAGNGPAAFNLKENLNFMQKVLGYPSEHVMYEAKSESGAKLYTDKDIIYYPVAKEKQVAAYYKDFNNYKWQFVTEEGVQDPVRVDLTLTKKQVKQIESMTAETAKTKIDLTEVNDANTVYLLEKISPDGVYTGMIEIVKYKGDWYWVSENTDEGKDGEKIEYNMCQKLPAVIE